MSAEYYGHEETAVHTDVRRALRDKYNNEGMGCHTDVRGASRDSYHNEETRKSVESTFNGL